MKTKIVAITGANSGIGKETAKALAARGHEIIMMCRNLDKAEKVRKEIVDFSHNNSIRIVHIDLASLASVKKAAMEYHERFGRLDVLINNAGLIAGNRKTTEDGFEYTFQVNHLSHFMLTNLLKDALKKGEKPKVITVSSDAHKAVRSIDWDNLQLEKKYHFFKAYALSKLWNVLFSNELAARFLDDGITSNSLHPGVAASNFGSSSTPFFSHLVKLGKPFLSSSKKCAETPVWLADSVDAEGKTGKYFYKRRQVPPSSLARERANAERLWKISAGLCSLDKALDEFQKIREEDNG